MVVNFVLDTNDLVYGIPTELGKMSELTYGMRLTPYASKTEALRAAFDAMEAGADSVLPDLTDSERFLRLILG